MRFVELSDDLVVAMTPVEESDAPALVRMINEPLPHMVMGREPRSLADVAALIRHWRRGDHVVFAIRNGPEVMSELLGCVGLFDIRHVDRNAEFRIFLAKDARGHGVGLAATRFAVEYGFTDLGLHRIWLGVQAENAPAIGCYQKAGFQREGVLRDETWIGGRFVDTVRMSILQS